jgi:hypothetical protein
VARLEGCDFLGAVAAAAGACVGRKLQLCDMSRWVCAHSIAGENDNDGRRFGVQAPREQPPPHSTRTWPHAPSDLRLTELHLTMHVRC